MSWVLGLTESNREKVFAFMRTLNEESDAAMKRAQYLQSGGLQVGAGHLDDLQEALARMDFLRALRNGLPPAEAVKAAQEGAKAAVAKHNSNRPKDMHWQRWEDTGQDIGPRLGERLTRVMG